MTRGRQAGRGASTAAGAGWPLMEGRLRAWPMAPADLSAFLRRCVETEARYRRLFPWIAVLFGCGILLFFSADGEPAIWAPLSAAALCTGGALAARSRPVAFGVAVALGAVFCGFSAAVIRQRHVHAPALERPKIARLSGFVRAVEERGQGARLLIDVHEIAGLAPEQRPRRARVTVRDLGALKPGLFIGATARLLPPPEPAWPGGYDFARDAYFRGIGAVGSIAGRVEIRAPPLEPDISLRLAAAVDEARNRVTRRIAEAIGGQAGAVAAALVTGKRGLIDEGTNSILRAAGIYHIVSISGLHMVLAAGTLFWLTRALLALSPAAALGWPLKKIAALVAMAGVSAYCVFSGSDVAAERSLVMTLIMLGAILADRPALSLRNLAISALIVLALEPEALLGPSFQMSYGAVAALIAASEWRPPWLAREHDGLVPRALAWCAAAVLASLGTTLIAQLATAPFGTYHFHTVNPFGLIGNALALPLVSLAIMPAAVAGMIAFPFGLDGPVWALMGLAVEGVLRVSAWVSAFRNSTIVVPAFGPGALALFGAALVLLCLAVSPLRWLAMIPAAAGLWLASASERADIYVDREGRGAAVRGPQAHLVPVGRASAFATEQWLRADGDAR